VKLDYSKRIKQVQATSADKNTTVVNTKSKAWSINSFMIIILIWSREPISLPCPYIIHASRQVSTPLL